MEQELEFPNDVHAVPIGGKRYAVVKTFNKTVYVNVREYYQLQDGRRMMAGRKGINLSIENWNRLSGSIIEINSAIDEQFRKLNQNQ